MKDDVAIKISHVSKNFVLPHEKTSSLKSAFTSLFSQKGKSTKQVALKDINFEIKKGEFFGIVGRNGSGKSTLLKIIAGIYQPTKGNVKVNGKLVPFIELGVGFNPELTGRENVFLNGAILGFTPKEIENNYDNIVKFAELEEHMDVKLKNYSSGMQVRLAFACATKAKADILLVDEILAVGDADFQRKCFDYFRFLKKIKKTVVFVTHDMDAIKEYCDKAILINENKILASDTPTTVAARYDKLFAEKITNQTEEKSKRWGNGSLLVKNIKVDTSSEGIVKLSYGIKAIKDTDDIVIGFMVKKSTGEPIMGTNSVIKALPVPGLKKGEQITSEWSFDNIFTDGKYYIDPAIVHRNGETIDWWEDAVSFRITSTEKVPYIVNPKIKLGIFKKGNSDE